MKKIIIAILALTCSLGASAQKKDVFHFGVGANLGTNGVGLDASIGLTRFVQIRGGISYVPQMDFNTNVKLHNEGEPVLQGAFNIPEKINVKVQPNMTTYHALLDLYPARRFHFTVGAYFGKHTPLKVFTDDGSLMEVTKANQTLALHNAAFPNDQVDPIGLQLGDRIFTPDSNGNVEAELRVKKMRPYFGIGFGRAVPRKSRVGASFDLGVQYWGKPAYYCNGEEINPSSIDEINSNKVWSTLSTIPVYPVVTLRIAGRII